jgi:SAM-dependent methyltransferase
VVRDLNFAATAERGRLMRCEACGSLYPDRFPAPDALAAVYGGYYTGRGRRHALRAWLGRLGRRRYLERHTPAGAGRILDFGCGGGAFLARMAIARPTALLFGTDRIRPRGPVVGHVWLDPEDLGRAAPADWITLGHVLEHVTAPAELVARLAKILGPGGGLWIATPNADSFLFRTAGAWARDVDFPRHREIFSRRGLRRLLADAGLGVSFTPAPRVNAVLNTLSTIGNILRDRELPRARRLLRACATLLALARHCLSGRQRREGESPELIAICRPLH